MALSDATIQRMKGPSSIKNQQQGTLLFHIQRALSDYKIIERLKQSLNKKRHNVTGNLERSINPQRSNERGGWKNKITSRLRTDDYLGLGIGIESVSVRIDMSEYGDLIDRGFKGADYGDIVQWIKSKARKYPDSSWYIYANGNRYEYSGERVTDKVASIIGKSITKKLNKSGSEPSKWQNVLLGDRGLMAAIEEGYDRYLRDYPDFAYAASIRRIDKMISKL